MRAHVVVDAEYTWPADAIGDWRACELRSGATVSCRVRTTLELRAGERFLRVAHEIDNHARDHRLRAHFPLPATVDGSDAECAFAVVAPRPDRRGRPARVRPADLPIAPFRRRIGRRQRRRARARRPPRVRGRRRRPRARADAAARRSDICRVRNRSCGRTRPARPIRSKGRSSKVCSARSTR